MSEIKLDKKDQKAFNEIMEFWEKCTVSHLEHLGSFIEPFQAIFKKHGLETWWAEIVPVSVFFQFSFQANRHASQMPLFSAISAELEKRAGVAFTHLETSDRNKGE